MLNDRSRLAGWSNASSTLQLTIWHWFYHGLTHRRFLFRFRYFDIANSLTWAGVTVILLELLLLLLASVQVWQEMPGWRLTRWVTCRDEASGGRSCRSRLLIPRQPCQLCRHRVQTEPGEQHLAEPRSRHDRNPCVETRRSTSERRRASAVEDDPAR